MRAAKTWPSFFIELSNNVKMADISLLFRGESRILLSKFVLAFRQISCYDGGTSKEGRSSSLFTCSEGK